jgi:hypothetical protein
MLLRTTDPDPLFWLLWFSREIMNITLMLITRSPNVESSCAKLRTENGIPTLVQGITNCNAISRSTEDQHICWGCKAVATEAHPLLNLIATPFVGLSPLSHPRLMAELAPYR